MLSKRSHIFKLITTTIIMLLLTLGICRIDNRVIRYRNCPPSESIFLTMVETSLEQCVDRCTRRPSCKAVGYKHLLRLCELSSSSSSPGIPDDHCMTIFRIDMDGNANDCGQWEVYETGHACVRKECPPLSPLQNGKYLGNMNHIGSKKAILCDPGYREEKEVKSTVCTSRGNWSYTGSCTKCPLSDSDWVKFSTPEEFHIMVLKKKDTQGNASTFCSGIGARLLQIDKKWKMHHVVGILKNCTALFGKQYWVDGSNTASQLEVWKFTDGSAVPMNKTFWHDEVLSEINAQRCVRLTKTAFLEKRGNYRLNFRNCSATYRKRGKLLPNERWTYNQEEIEAVDNFNYLGTVFNYTGNFNLNQEYKNR